MIRTNKEIAIVQSQNQLRRISVNRELDWKQGAQGLGRILTSRLPKFRVIYLALCAGVGPFTTCAGLEKQIQTTEMTQNALTRRRIAAKTRSPPGPAEFQSGFQVRVAHTNNVNEVDATILVTFRNNDELEHSESVDLDW
jgi:hypothetical protein